jgi:hypothetical protein
LPLGITLACKLLIVTCKLLHILDKNNSSIYNQHMSTPAHIISGAYLGVITAHIAPSETNYILIALVSGGILDLDHVYYFIKDWKYYKENGFIGKMHRARSFFHEMIGFFLIGAVMLLLSYYDTKLSLVIGIPYIIHATEDIIMGKSTPFTPFDKTSIQFVPQNMKLKTIVDISVIIIFSFLWILYLNAAK